MTGAEAGGRAPGRLPNAGNGECQRRRRSSVSLSSARGRCGNRAEIVVTEPVTRVALVPVKR
jgi:hypothetical protein